MNWKMDPKKKLSGVQVKEKRQKMNKNKYVDRIISLNSYINSRIKSSWKKEM